MKSSTRLLALLIFVFSVSGLMAQKNKSMQTETFKVYGNCGMCKKTIEGALLKKDGIQSKSWSSTTKMLTVTFDPSKIALSAIKQKIADVGYDTDEVRAKDEVYDALNPCCHYKRPGK